MDICINELIIDEFLPLSLSKIKDMGKLDFEGREFNLYHLVLGTFEKIFIDGLQVNHFEIFTREDKLVRYLINFDEFNINDVFARLLVYFPDAEVLTNNDDKCILKDINSLIEINKKYDSGYMIKVSSLSNFYSTT